MRAKYLILRLRVEKKNKLSKRRAKSYSIAFKENFMAQVAKLHDRDC